MQLIPFNFSGANRVTLVDSTNYCAVVSFNGGNNVNYIIIGGDATTPSHAGHMIVFQVPPSTWHSAVIGDVDVCFYVYGVGSPVVGTKYPLPAFRRS